VILVVGKAMKLLLFVIKLSKSVMNLSKKLAFLVIVMCFYGTKWHLYVIVGQLQLGSKPTFFSNYYTTDFGVSPPMSSRVSFECRTFSSASSDFPESRSGLLVKHRATPLQMAMHTSQHPQAIL
jgi:hypothetical protein